MFEFIVSGSLTSTCLVGLVVGLVVYWMIQKWKYKYPPGPPGLPFIGNALQIDPNKLHKQAFEWSKKYGPVITVRTGPVQFVVVNTIETALEVLVKKSTDFAGRMLTPSIELFTYGGKDIIFSTYSPTWKLHRRIASKALRLAPVCIAGVINDSPSHYMQGDALETRVHDAAKTAFVEIDKLQGEFDPTEYINYIVGNILTGLCYGGKYSFEDKEEVNYMLEKEDNFLQTFGLGALEDFIPGLRYVYKSDKTKFLEEFLREVFDGTIAKKLKEAEKTFDKDNIRHFTDTLILARKEAEAEEGVALSSLTDKHLIQTLADIFFAGTNTSRFTLKAAILHMVAFPDIQDKVQEEIDKVLGSDRLPAINDRPNLSYTEAVLHESMRLASISPLGIQHMTICDTEVGGYKIPKGTGININHWALHNDHDAWEEVERFIPERYLDENGKLGSKPKNWLPFSAGKRVCLGEVVAKSELHLIFASLMQRYKWRMVSGKCPNFDQVGVIALDYQPYKVIVEKRI